MAILYSKSTMNRPTHQIPLVWTVSINMVYLWPVTWLVPGYYMKQCWHMVNLTFSNNFQSEFNQNLYVFYETNAFYHAFFQMSDLLCPPFCFCLSMLTSNATGIILCMHPANERWGYIVTSSLIGRAYTRNDLWAHNTPDHENFSSFRCIH